MQIFENLLLKNYSTKFLDITYKWSLGMCNQSLFKWWRHLHYWRNNSQRQFENRKFDANLSKSSPKLLNKILRHYIQMVLGYVKSKFVQMVAPPTLLAK